VLFLKEQIKDIIIIFTRPIQRKRPDPDFAKKAHIPQEQQFWALLSLVQGIVLQNP
jgi:hypothetical protein